MSTVATKSWNIRMQIKSYLEKSGDVSGLNFKYHDFGLRGVSSLESGMLGGLAHLATGAMGTDTAVGILAANMYYDADIYNTGFSICAAEHSVITSWGKDREALAYENMVRQFSKPGSIYAVVSDSYDIFNAVEMWGTQLKDIVVSSGGTLVIRPDSGDPLEVIPRLVRSLAKNFGTTKNDKGFLVLNNVRLIWGDGITALTISSILRVLVDVMGFSADNIAFGAGGALLQIVNRDDQKFAMKCSAAFIGDSWVDVFKDPVTDLGKTSKKGRFSVVMDDDQFKTIPYDPTVNDLLTVRYSDGRICNETNLSEIRSRCN